MIWNEIQTRGAQKHNFELVGWYIGGRYLPADSFLCCYASTAPCAWGSKLIKCRNQGTLEKGPLNAL